MESSPLTRIEPRPLHRVCRVLAIGLPRKVLEVYFCSFLFSTERSHHGFFFFFQTGTFRQVQSAVSLTFPFHAM